MKEFLSLIVIILYGFLSLSAQEIIRIKIPKKTINHNFIEYLESIDSLANARIFYMSHWIESLKSEEQYSQKPLGHVLDTLFAGTDLDYIVLDDYTLVIIKNPEKDLLKNKILKQARKYERNIMPFKFGEPGSAGNRQIIKVKGYVRDADTREPLPYSNIEVSIPEYSTTSDSEGAYTLDVPPGEYALIFTHINYNPLVIDLHAYADGEINLLMEKASTMLEEVVIKSNLQSDQATTKIGEQHLNVTQILKAPAFLGEPDLIKQVQSLAGVTTVGEAATGFNVRGGSVDQNLILFDGVPSYTSSHAFGFFSAFNPDIVRDISFYNGGISAEYGGRISSVLNIISKDGDYKKWHGKMGIGMINGNIMVNGPIVKDKASLLASFRSTYSNWLTKSIKTDYTDLSESSVNFYDASLKIAYLLNKKSKLSLSGYRGNDKFSIFGDTTYHWNNSIASVRIDHQFDEKLRAEFLAGLTSYGYNVENNSYNTAARLSYRINTLSVKSDFNYEASEHSIKFGWQLEYNKINPGSVEPLSPLSNAKNYSLNPQYSFENALYINDAFLLGKNITVEAGLRIPLFSSFGPSEVYLYHSTDRSHITDTLMFNGFEVVKNYLNVEPRLSLRWLFNVNSSLKMGYNRLNQYIHLVTNTTAVTPIDIWQPSNYYFKPQYADQVSVGYFTDLADKMYGFSTEIFYKRLFNILDFKDGAELILNKRLEMELEQGRGTSYGTEISIRKNYGKLTGYLNYTYSRAFRTFKSSDSEGGINRGRRYPANFDQPHIINLSWDIFINRRVSFTGNFTYHTGRPITIPLSSYNIEQTTVINYSDRNQYRLPDYHRLDVAFVRKGSFKRDKKLEGSWVLSFYNVYGRKNPYSVFYNIDRSGVPKGYQLSIIGTVLPSLSYNLKFK